MLEPLQADNADHKQGQCQQHQTVAGEAESPDKDGGREPARAMFGAVFQQQPKRRHQRQ